MADRTAEFRAFIASLPKPPAGMQVGRGREGGRKDGRKHGGGGTSVGGVGMANMRALAQTAGCVMQKPMLHAAYAPTVQLRMQKFE